MRQQQALRVFGIADAVVEQVQFNPSIEGVRTVTTGATPPALKGERSVADAMLVYQGVIGSNCGRVRMAGSGDEADAQQGVSRMMKAGRPDAHQYPASG